MNLKSEINLEREKKRYDPILRRFLSISRYAVDNNIYDKVLHILKRNDAEVFSKLSLDELTKQDDLPQYTSELPKLKRALDQIDKELVDDIKNARKGLEPIIQPLTYDFTDNSGRNIRFTIDPNNDVVSTLRDFENLVKRLPRSDAILAQFIPTFKIVKGELAYYDWDKNASKPKATLITIKRLCDEWSD